MNAKILQEINKKEAFQILNVLFENKYWDPVKSTRMTNTQCYNYLVSCINRYFSENKNLIFWNKYTYLDHLDENKEFIPMMQNYNYNKYKDEIEN